MDRKQQSTDHRAGRGPRSERGRDAVRPGEIPLTGWKDILKRTWEEQSRDNVSVVAAGVAFLVLLALFPAMSAIFSIYGLIADPQQIESQMNSLAGVLPPQAYEIISNQLHELAGQSGGALGFGLAVSLLVALWSAAGGVRALMMALNIAYSEEEKRGMIAFYGTALVLTLGLILLLIATLAIVVVVPIVVGFLPLGTLGEWLIRILRWPILGGALIVALAVLYRYAPSRRRPEWRWVTWGAVAATGLWVVGSIIFSIYINNFADYNATYGSLGAGIILLLWLYLGAYAVLLGAELDAEIEHQTARDTTEKPEKPMGSRGARMADTIGPAKG